MAMNYIMDKMNVNIIFVYLYIKISQMISQSTINSLFSKFTMSVLEICFQKGKKIFKYRRIL